MSDLLPCPFCGNSVNWCDCIEGGCDQIECKSCVVNLSVNNKVSMTSEELSEVKKEAARIWNTRTYPPHVQAIERALEAAVKAYKERS